MGRKSLAMMTSCSFSCALVDCKGSVMHNGYHACMMVGIVCTGLADLLYIQLPPRNTH